MSSWMQWKRFGWIFWGLELASAAIEVAHAEGAGSEGGGQDALGLAGFLGWDCAGLETWKE